MIWHALGHAVEWVKRVARVGRGHDPFMMHLVQTSVDCRVVQAPMDPVDAKVGEEDKQWKLRNVVPLSWPAFARVVDS